MMQYMDCSRHFMLGWQGDKRGHTPEASTETDFEGFEEFGVKREAFTRLIVALLSTWYNHLEHVPYAHH